MRAFLGLAVCSSGLAFVVSLAAPPIQGKLDDPAPEDRLRQARKELSRLREEMKTLSLREEGVLSEVERLDAVLRVRSAELQEAGARADSLRQSLGAREKRLRDLRARVEERARWLRQRIREMYKAGPWSEAALLLGVGNTDEVLEGLRTALSSVERDRRALRDWRADSVEVEQELSRLRAESATLDAVLEDERELSARLHRDRLERQRALDRIREDRDQRTRAVRELEEAARNLGILTRDGGSAERGDLDLDIREFRGLLEWPFANSRIVAGFGDHLHPRFHTVVPHPGLDLEGPEGETFRSIFDGRVVYASNLRGYGLTALVDHGDGLVSVYAQASALLVSRGQKVLKGQPLGRVGDPAFRGAAGIYFELRDEGEPVDPIPWLRRR